MRWYQQIENYEYLESEDYNRFWARMGEMGEIIEWLLCNYFSDLDITGNNAGKYIQVTCWGSYAGQHRITPNQRQIIIRPGPGKRLFQGLPMVRVRNAEELREFLSNEQNWDRNRENIAALLRAPPEMVVDMVDADQAYTGHDIRPGKRGRKYRHAARSIRNQYVRKSIWKKKYCSPIESPKHNNKLKQLVPPPLNLRMLPDTLHPQIVQISFFLVFLCFSLAMEFGSSGLGLGNSFNFVYAIPGCYFFYMTFFISLQKSLRIFGIEQMVPTPRQ